ncbi:G-protein coupled receptor 4-like [Xyrichtys novacula]|uniref:G-protein coupled receptor 4-like n=1 Tax=Xyrichtys novacula TaxID=13765 RepID=A0AAV1G1Q3_XYRNO|nr:G-protein coupled receptor 4-like [Xyrichtys novacula]
MENIYKNTTSPIEDYYDTIFPEQNYEKIYYIMYVCTCIIISIGLPLTLLTIYALYSLVTKDHVSPIYIINLLISDIMQFSIMIVWVFGPMGGMTGMAYYFIDRIYECGLVTSVCFMVCVSLERYLVIVHPLWYRYKHTIKTSVVVCVMVWVINLVFTFAVFSWVDESVTRLTFSIFLLLPFPLFIFFLVRTLKALSASVSVNSAEKQRIVGILVSVLVIYTLLFLPITIMFLVEEAGFYSFLARSLCNLLIQLSPLADLVLYIFIRKATMGKLLASVCCCKEESNDSHTSAVSVGNVVPPEGAAVQEMTVGVSVSHTITPLMENV